MFKQNSQNLWLAWLSGLTAIAFLVSLLLLKNKSPQVNAENITNPPIVAESISYDTLVLPRSIVHIVRIPATTSAVITPIIDPSGLKTVDHFGQQQNAIAVINGGFFDPNNQQTTSFVTKEGKVVLDPSTNSRLVDNPNLTRYMPQILNRSEFRRYHCDSKSALTNRSTKQYAIAPHQQRPPTHCRIIDALGAGPALLPKFRGEAEAFVDPAHHRDAIGSNSRNARSAIGITADGSILLIMAAQRAEVSGSSGLSLAELADVMTTRLDVIQGLNLDGGSSASLYYNGQTYYGRLDANQRTIERPVKSVLAVVVPE